MRNAHSIQIVEDTISSSKPEGLVTIIYHTGNTGIGEIVSTELVL